MRYRDDLGDETGRLFNLPGGFLEYRFAPAHTTEVVNIEVQSRERRKGIGRELLDLVEVLEHSKRVYGFTSEDNRIAQDFYRGCGYTLIHLPDFYGKGSHAFLFHKVVKE
jgi:ribosomal protein S18 acetylase RimI-like enzyme